MTHTELTQWLEQHGYKINEPTDNTKHSGGHKWANNWKCSAINAQLGLKVSWTVIAHELNDCVVFARSQKGGYATRKWANGANLTFLSQEALSPGYLGKITRATLDNLPEPRQFVPELCAIYQSNHMYWSNTALDSPVIRVSNTIDTCCVVFIAHLNKQAKVVEHRGENGFEPWYFMLCMTSTSRRFVLITDGDVYHPVHYSTLRVGSFDNIADSTQLNAIDQQLLCKAIQHFLHGVPK